MYILQDIDNVELRQNVWAGIIPVQQSHGEPIPAEYNLAQGPKAYWSDR